MEKTLSYSNKTFSDNLDYLISKSSPKITKKQLDQEIGVADGYLSRYTKEGAEHQPSVHVMKLLADRLNVTIDELMYQDLAKKDAVSRAYNLSEKEKEFLEVLIENTKATKFKWENFDMWRRVLEFETPYDALFEGEYDEDGHTGHEHFESKLSKESIHQYRIKGYLTRVNNDNEVLIAQFIDIAADDVYLYEVYAIKNNKVLPCFFERANQGMTYEYLNKLWDAIEIDAPRKEVVDFYEEVIRCKKSDGVTIMEI